MLKQNRTKARMNLCSAMIAALMMAGAASSVLAYPAPMQGYQQGGIEANSMQEDNIAAIQARLIQYGYYVGKYGLTGHMNDSTREAVKHFQRNMGLTEDGVVGEKTAAALNQGMYYRQPYARQPYYPPQPGYYSAPRIPGYYQQGPMQYAPQMQRPRY